MLEQFGADPHRARSEKRFEHEDRKTGGDREHRSDEEQRDRSPEMGAGETARKEKDDDRADQEDLSRRSPYFWGCAGLLSLSVCQGWRVWGAGQLLGFVGGFGFVGVRSAGGTLRGWPP